MRYAVLYQSDTGNTEKIAVAIYEELPGINKDLCRIRDLTELPEADYYFIGFSVFQGTCRMSVMDVLSQLHHKKVAVFATCGCAVNEAYRSFMEKHIRLWIDPDNIFVGMFLCQGKMPEQFRSRCQAFVRKMEEKGVRMDRLDFNEAKLHPSEDDIRKAREFTRQICIREGYLLE